MPLSLTITGAVAARALPTKEHPHHAEDHTHAHPHEHNEEPVVEALPIYVDRINAAGGVNGKTINLLIEDDLAMPWKAAANTKKLFTENRAVLKLNASPSPTYAGIIAEAKNAGVPLIFASSVCPKNAYPPTNESQFCTTASAATYDSRAQSRGACIREGRRDGAGKDCLCRHGHSAIANRDGFCRARGHTLRSPPSCKQAGSATGGAF